MVASIPLCMIPASSMMSTSSCKELGELEPELPWLAGKAGTAGTEHICCCSNQRAGNILLPQL